MARPNSKSKANRGFHDQSGQYPKIEHLNDASTSKAARGHKVNKVYTGGGDKDLSLGLKSLVGSQYPKNQVRETESGHVLEFDDTPGNQRVVILHNSKAGIEIRPDGTVIISSGSEGNRIEIVGNDHKMIVERNGDVHYKGNLNFKVDGNMNLDVGGNLKMNVGGNEISTVDGNYKQTVAKSHTSSMENKAQYVLGTHTDISLGNKYTTIKGDEIKLVGGQVQYNVESKLLITAGTEIDISTPNANIAATDMSILSSSGTIGGAGVTMYANTFKGNLDGTADKSLETNLAAGIGFVNVASPSFTLTVEPSTVISDYLNSSSLGVRKVSIDVGGDIASAIREKKIDISKVRNELHSESNLLNSKFIGTNVADGTLSYEVAKTAPKEIGRIIEKKQSAYGQNPIGQVSNSLTKKFKER